jgi:signal transduction histidine kinase
MACSAFSQIAAGTVSYDVEVVPMDETLATCEALTLPQARARGLELHFSRCDPALTVRADREKVHQIVLNLISNAVKFTDAGGRIELACTAQDDAVAITVTDTGRGSAHQRLAQVFEPFVQVDTSRTRKHDGVGLGLAISRDLARGMNGDLTVESTPGAGSKFTLTLPRIPEPRAQAAVAALP